MAVGFGTLKACAGRAFGLTVGMLKIGYARQRDVTGHWEIADLEAAGFQVVRIEPSATGQDVLISILEFIGPGDQLIVPQLDHLAVSRRTLLDTRNRLPRAGLALPARGKSTIFSRPDWDPSRSPAGSVCSG